MLHRTILFLPASSHKSSQHPVRASVEWRIVLLVREFIPFPLQACSKNSRAEWDQIDNFWDSGALKYISDEQLVAKY